MKPFPHATLFCCLVLSAFAAATPGPAAADPFPYDFDAETDAALVLGTGVAFGLGWWLDRDFRPFTEEETRGLDRSDIPAFDRFASRRWSMPLARTSDALVTSQLFIPLALPVSGEGSRRPLPLAAMHVETVALTGGLTYLLKNAFDRTRPLVYNDDPAVPMEIKTSPMARKSFPSGHTSSAFSTMVFLATVFGKINPDSPHKDLVWGACLTTASVSGALRIACGRHYPSDVLAGAALGSFVGWAVPQLHEIDESGGADPAKSKPTISIAWRVGF